MQTEAAGERGGQKVEEEEEERVERGREGGRRRAWSWGLQKTRGAGFSPGERTFPHKRTR